MEPFRHFNLPHLLAIGLACFLFLITIVIKNEKQANILRGILLGGLIVRALWYHAWQILFEHNWTWQRHLPLHISQVSIILTIVALIIRRHDFYQFVYYWAGWSSLLSLLFPELHENFPHPRFIEFFLGYLLLLTSISYIYFIEKVNITRRYLWMTAGVLFLYSMIIYPLNFILKTNFLFLVEKPELGELMKVLPAPPWHIPFFMVAVLLLLYVQYLLGTAHLCRNINHKFSVNNGVNRSRRLKRSKG